MSENKQDSYYDLLGVDEDATEKEIRTAFREKVKKLHPDKNPGLKEEEIAENSDQLRELFEAKEILLDEEKRRIYDLEGVRRGAHYTSEGSTRRKTGQEGYRDLFNELFGDLGDLFDKEGGLFTGWEGFTRSRANQGVTEITIPESDWGLFYALREAYASDGEGIWEVKILEEDDRDWMPETIYEVRRTKAGKVRISRTVADWRVSLNRDREIRHRNIYGEEHRENLAPDSLLGEEYLYGDDRETLFEESSLPNSRELRGYIKAMKNLARRSAQGEKIYTDDPELRNINLFGQHYSKNTRMEGLRWASDTDREWVHTVPISKFSKRVREAGNYVVQVEVGKKGKEGQSPKPPEGEDPGYGGESLS